MSFFLFFVKTLLLSFIRVYNILTSAAAMEIINWNIVPRSDISKLYVGSAVLLFCETKSVFLSGRTETIATYVLKSNACCCGFL